jgi:hypothetical protein
MNNTIGHGIAALALAGALRGFRIGGSDKGASLSARMAA